MRTFTVERGNDESGISGTGVVMEGVEFSDGRVVILWLTTPASMVEWDSFDDFKKICIDGHPSNNTIVRWGDGEVWWQNGPEEWQDTGAAKGVEVEVDSEINAADVRDDLILLKRRAK